MKQALPAAGVARLRDVTKKDFGKFVDDDNRYCYVLYKTDFKLMAAQQSGKGPNLKVVKWW